jgi:BMFP domain-containing protein YqiC
MEDKRDKASKILDDIAKIAGDALGAIGSLKTEAEASLRSRLENCINKMDLVSREEFKVMEEMIAKCREEQEMLKNRITQLEQAKHNHE